jgi:hypothetical protein
MNDEEEIARARMEFEEHLPEQKTDTKSKKVYKAGGVTNIGVVYESVSYKDKPYFLVYLPALKRFKLKEEIEGSEESILPHKGRTPYRPYIVTDELLEELNTAPQDPKKLYSEVLQEFDDFLDLETKYKHLLTTEVFETYVQHRLETLSYLFCLGAKESGKSRALKLLLALTYRPMKTSSLPVADVYRYLGEQGEAGGTILHDQAEYIERARARAKLPESVDDIQRQTHLQSLSKDGLDRSELCDNHHNSRFPESAVFHSHSNLAFLHQFAANRKAVTFVKADKAFRRIAGAIDSVCSCCLLSPH